MFTYLLALCPGTAFAHAGAVLDAIDVIGPLSEDQLSLETTVGYLRRTNAETFEWVCHESVTQPEAIITPQYIENPNGVVLVSIGDKSQAREVDQTVYRSEDMCNWTAPDGLRDQQIVDFAFNPNDADHVLAVTGNRGDSNNLYKSNDAGLTWTPTALSIDNAEFRSIRFGPNATNSVWISAVRHETHEAWIFHSADSGESWSEHALSVIESGDLDIFVDVLIADGDNPNRAWVVMGPYLDDRLLETTDGGASFSEVYLPEGDIIDGAQDEDGALWLITTGNKVIYSESGEFFQRLQEAPLSLGVSAQLGAVYLANRIPSEGYAMSISRDGDNFSPIDVFSNLNGPPACTAGTHSAEFCEPLWSELESLVGPADDSGEPTVTDTEPSEPDPSTTEPRTPSAEPTKRSRCQAIPLHATPAWTAMSFVVLLVRRRKPTKKRLGE